MSKAVDWTSEERKLGPVYDDIQNRRYKIADQQVSRWLKKHPKSQPALVLRMVLLQKLRSGAEAVLRAYEDIKKTGQLSGRSVWWIVLALRGISRLDLVLELYEELWDDQPEITDLGQQVYLTAASMGDSETMMQSSRKMFNLTKSSVWARSAAYSQWYHAAPRPTTSTPFPPPAPAKSLLVAQTLLKTALKTSETPDHFWLRIQILLSAGQNNEALELLKSRGDYGALSRLWTRMGAVVVIAERIGDEEGQKIWREEWEWVVGILNSDGDEKRNYAFYRHFLLATEKLASNDAAIVSKARDILGKLHDKIGKKERAPQLALLELDTRLHKLGHGNLALKDDNWLEQIKGYWEKWASKGSIITEIEGLVEDDESRSTLVLGLLDQTVKGGHSDLQTYLSLVHAEILLLRKKSADWKPAPEDVLSIWKLYREGLQYGLNLAKTDVQPADLLGYAAVQLMITMWHDKRSDETPVLQAIACLEYIISKSPSAAHARFLLIRLYRSIGAPSLLEPHLTALKISEIQLDNLLHVFFERGSTDALLGGLRDTWETQAKAAKQMYSRSETDLPEYIKVALENESYSKIHSMRELATSIDRSLSSKILLFEDANLALTFGQPLPEESLSALSTALAEKSPFVDIRNYELVPEIGGMRLSVQEMIKSKYDVGERWVRVMGGLVVLLGKYGKGEQIGLDELELGSLDGLSPSEAVLVSTTIRLLRRASLLLSGTEDADDLNDISFDELINTCNNQTGSREENIHAHITIIRMTRILDILLAHLQELNQTSKKGKKQTSPALTEFIKTLKNLKDGLGLLMKELAKDLEGFTKVDEGIKISFLDGLLEDDSEFVHQLEERIKGSRKAVVDGLKMMLSGKK